MYDYEDQNDRDDALALAVSRCDPEAIRNTLANHGDPNVYVPFEMEDGQVINKPLLHLLIACSMNASPKIVHECMNLLIHGGAHVEAVDTVGNRAVHESLMYEMPNPAALLALLEAGAEVNVAGQYGLMPLHLAAGHMAPLSARLLLAADAKADALSLRTDSTFPVKPMQIAEAKQNDEMIDLLTEALEKPSKPSPLLVKRNLGLDLKKREVALKQKTMEKSLFSEIMSQDEANQLLLTGLNLCDTEIMRKALRSKADPNMAIRTTKNAGSAGLELVVNGQTPLHYLMQTTRFQPAEVTRECVKVLLDAGANVEAKDAWDNRPIHEALCNDFPNEAGVAALIEAGVDVNALGIGGATPLHFAAKHFNLVPARMLLAAGANLQPSRDTGRPADQFSPLEIAKTKDNHEMVKLLEHALANPQDMADVGYVKAAFNLDLAKRQESLEEKPAKEEAALKRQQAAIKQQELDGFIKKKPLATKISSEIKAAKAQLSDLHSIQYYGKMSEEQKQDLRTYYKN